MTLSRALMIHNNKLVDPQRHSRVAGSETFSAPDATEAGSRFVSSDAEEATVRHLGGPFISETVTLGSDDLALVIDPQRAVRDMAKELVFRYGTNDVADFVPAYDLQKQRRPQLETIGSKPGSADRFFDNLVCWQIPVSEDQYQTHQEDRRQAPVESGDSERARGHHWLPTHLAHRSEFTIHDADLAEDIPGTMDPYSRHVLQQDCGDHAAGARQG
mmetsp:Transcript_38145/g.59497  ORF Transcript_38145/g.59497 Transcript_38145/m.59497 type:complete len:216 (+) Transcript_38145:152-799(+)